jgi:DNA/RNA endonuclease YhcR with UshA esterase domain
MAEKDSKENNSEKIQSLREMIYSAEKTLQGAKSMLLQLEGKKKVGRKKKTSSEDEDGKIIEGTFDGQIMIGTDGKQYPVPANYASKSKLVEGDVLKLTITPDGSFIYKQIGPAERKRVIGTVNQDGEGNYFVLAENKPFRVLLASITYFKVAPGDEVTLITPRDIESDWGAIENILLGARNKKIEEDESPTEVSAEKSKSVIDEWMPNLEDLKKELKDE